MVFEDRHAFAAAEVATTRADAVPADAGAVAAVKDYLRIENDAEDALIARLVAVAVGHGERFIRRMLIVRTVCDVVRPTSSWTRLAGSPVSAITQVEGLAADGSAAMLAAGSYAIDIDAGGDGWVRLTANGPRRVRVTYTAGLAESWSALPEPIAQGVVRLAAHLFTHRDGADAGAPPAAVAALWRPWRRVSL
jgi:uncharacterized phiE125 gp8 family phage protein